MEIAATNGFSLAAVHIDNNHNQQQQNFMVNPDEVNQLWSIKGPAALSIFGGKLLVMSNQSMIEMKMNETDDFPGYESLMSRKVVSEAVTILSAKETGALLELCNCLDEKHYTMEFTGNNSPVKIVGNKFRALIMPMEK